MTPNPFTSPMKNSFARMLAKKVTLYLRDPEHRREFEEWYLNHYGKEYVWKKVCKNEEPA